MAQQAARCGAFRTAGKLRSVRGLMRADLPAFVGETCSVKLSSGDQIMAEVVGFDESESQLMCFDSTSGLRPGLEIIAEGRARSVPVGASLLGRVIDGLGRPIDKHGPLKVRRWRSESATVPDAMFRTRITEPLVTGQRVIDGMLTIGRGQRVGLFAGSGVGKSTLMGEIAKYAESDVNVIALVGERGREVLPFIEDCLGEQGLSRSVVVVATSDETPLMRIKAVLTAASIAEDFRDQGAHVLFFLDSLTRLAMAQRELGLLLGEPPGARGYPPSVQSLLASVLERLGCGEVGAITGLITVLVDGDDMDEPITDAARGILDGHIVLNRKIAATGHFPAVDVLNSVSRVFREVTTDDHQKHTSKLRSLLATHSEIADLIQIGAYKAGTSPQVDRAVQIMPAAKRFLQQSVNQRSSWQETQDQLKALAGAWPW
ncbi:MAG: FliI/YscN family ATPase [Planctomycetaceae bacterium]|nr:FliI/YscN family ATPase [Planctomycetaceae bacterium]